MKDNIYDILEFVQFILNLTGHQENSQTKMRDSDRCFELKILLFLMGYTFLNMK